MNDILFGNNNKAVIKKLANRSFRSNKMRNVIAAIAIALTTFLWKCQEMCSRETPKI